MKSLNLTNIAIEELSSPEARESEDKQGMELKESGASLGENGAEFLAAMEVSYKQTFIQMDLGFSIEECNCCKFGRT